MKIKIFYCVVLNYKPRAACLAVELKRLLGIDSENVLGRGGFWRVSRWEKSFFQAEAFQVLWARGSFKNHPEKIFLKKILSWKWKTVLLIKLTISWAKLSQNILFQNFYREFNGFGVGLLYLNNLTSFQVQGTLRNRPWVRHEFPVSDLYCAVLLPLHV